MHVSTHISMYKIRIYHKFFLDVFSQWKDFLMYMKNECSQSHWKLFSTSVVGQRQKYKHLIFMLKYKINVKKYIYFFWDTWDCSTEDW